MWDVTPPRARASSTSLTRDESTSLRVGSGLASGLRAPLLCHPAKMANLFKDTLTYALSKFVSIPSVSCDPAHKEDCRQAAIWLKKCLVQLGAHSTLVSRHLFFSLIELTIFIATNRRGEQPHSTGYFRRLTQRTAKNKSTVLWVITPYQFARSSLILIAFLSHYDVISAPLDGWHSDPFTVSGLNGYLYGRGVTDNKGPIMAVACAAADLLSRRALEIDLVLLIEGEEECGSSGFNETVRKHKVCHRSHVHQPLKKIMLQNLIGDIDAILVR